MQRFFCFLIAFMASVFLLVQTTQAQVVPISPTKVGEYQKRLDELKEVVKNLTNDKFYEEHFNFKNAKSGKSQNFSEFSEFDRRVFQMTTTQKLNGYLDKLDETWSDNLKNVKGKVPDSNGKADVDAGADDIAKFIDELVKVRKEAADNWEKQANKIFEDFPKEFDEKDIALYLKNITILKNSLKKK